jgi:hypothetical protein
MMGLRSDLALLSWLICAMESWLCVPAAEDPEGGADHNGGEDEEDAGLDAWKTQKRLAGW